VFAAARLSRLIRISFDTGRCWSLLDAILAVLIGSQMERKDRALFALSHIYSDHLYTQEAKQEKEKGTSRSEDGGGGGGGGRALIANCKRVT
jgi:hypothetical protein